MESGNFLKDLDVNTLYYLIYNLSASHAIRCEEHKTFVIAADDALELIHLLNKEKAMTVINNNTCVICYLHQSEIRVLQKLMQQIQIVGRAKDFYETVSPVPSFEFVDVKRLEDSDNSNQSLPYDSEDN